jgi:hypothetical protein
MRSVAKQTLLAAVLASLGYRACAACSPGVAAGQLLEQRSRAATQRARGRAAARCQAREKPARPATRLRPQR